MTMNARGTKRDGTATVSATQPTRPILVMSHKTPAYMNVDKMLVHS